MKYNAINVKYNQPQTKYNGAFVVSGFDYSNFTTTTTSFVEVISSGLMSFSVMNSTGAGMVSLSSNSDNNHIEFQSDLVKSSLTLSIVDLVEENIHSAEIKTINISTMGTSS